MKRLTGKSGYQVVDKLTIYLWYVYVDMYAQYKILKEKLQTSGNQSSSAPGIEPNFSFRGFILCQLSYYAPQCDVTVLDVDRQPNHVFEKRYHGYGRQSERQSALMLEVTSRFGLITSFTGTYETNVWNLTVGLSSDCQKSVDDRQGKEFNKFMNFGVTIYVYTVHAMVFPYCLNGAVAIPPHYSQCMECLVS